MGETYVMLFCVLLMMTFEMFVLGGAMDAKYQNDLWLLIRGQSFGCRKFPKLSLTRILRAVVRLEVELKGQMMTFSTVRKRL